MADTSVAVTGATSGIGRAIAEMFLSRGAKVAISDVRAPTDTAATIGASAHACDVTSEAAVVEFIRAASEENGPVDVFVSNAGVGFPDGGHAGNAPDDAWETSWRVNVLASVFAARALLPGWLSQGRGRFVVTASAAGLLNQIDSASYTATKHAAVAFAESLAITHRDDGVSVHCICPQYVRTNMTDGMEMAERHPDGLIEPKAVADALATAIDAGAFLVTPHPQVRDYEAHKVRDRDQWLAQMAQLRKKWGSSAF